MVRIMRNMSLILSLSLLLGQTSTSLAATTLSKKELAAGKETITRFKNGLHKADEEDRRLYEALTKDKKFFAIWARSVADRENSDKLKALIRASRRLRLWGSVGWMLQALSELEPGSPAFYRLSALAQYEQGKVSQAYHRVYDGVLEHPMHRGLRRIWYSIHKKHEETKGPKLKDVAAVKETINIELCVVRSNCLKEKLNHYRDEGKLPPAFSKSSSPEKLMKMWQDFLLQKGELPADYELDYDCQYVCHKEPLDWLSVSCLTHENRFAKFSNGEKIYRGKLFVHKVAEDLIRKVVSDESFVYRQKALEFLLMRYQKLDEVTETQVLALLENPKISSSVLNRHLQAVVHYLRRYKASTALTRAIENVARKARGANKALCTMALYWCGYPPKELSDEQLMYLLPMDGIRDLIKLPGGRSDVEKLIYDTLVVRGPSSVERLRKLARKLNLPRTMAEANLKIHFSKK